MSRTLLLVALLIVARLAQGAEIIEAFGLRWFAPVASDWKYSNGVLELLVPRPSMQPRRPSQYVIADTAPFRKVTLRVELQAEPRAIRDRRNSVILVYAWRDPEHFNYAHLSVDAAKDVPVHNGIFHVYGGDRVRISSEEGPPALRDETWHQVKLTYDAGTGRVDVWVDGKTSPSFRAVDMSLGPGKVGLGSFFDTGKFRSFRLEGQTVR
ncbi:MAG: hypothetical protein NZV14_12255 [Bryobacteraceae bacterium]|nr:hypothetical protein [Bryobacteraceae bacterium]MDW8378925.1 hypothetical protein [Bryobacterales bacterium]